VAASVVAQPRRQLHPGDAAGASPHERRDDLVETRAEHAKRVLVAGAQLGSPCMKISRRRGQAAWAAYRISAKIDSVNERPALSPAFKADQELARKYFAMMPEHVYSIGRNGSYRYGLDIDTASSRR